VAGLNEGKPQAVAQHAGASKSQPYLLKKLLDDVSQGNFFGLTSNASFTFLLVYHLSARVKVHSQDALPREIPPPTRYSIRAGIGRTSGGTKKGFDLIDGHSSFDLVKPDL
jgi:hypothetical protein